MSHNKLYYNLELLKRAGQDFIDIGDPIVYPNIFGNRRMRSCQIGTQNIKHLNTSLFLTVYTNFPEDADNKVTNYIVPLIVEQSRRYSAPILINQNNTFTVMSKLIVKFEELQEKKVQQPLISIQYKYKVEPTQ